MFAVDVKMTTSSTIRRLLVTCLVLVCVWLSAPAQAPPKMQPGEGGTNSKLAILDQVGIDQAGEVAVVAVMVPHLAGMRTRRHQHRPVLKIAIVEQHADREHIVIGVRIECPVLMPLDRRTILCRLHVQL